MANAFYSKGLEKFLGGDIDMASDTVKMLLCSASYSANMSTDEFHDDIPGGSIVATSGALSGKSITNGVFDASDVIFTAVSGSQVTQIPFYIDSGVSATSPLICRFDVATGLPVTPNGGDISVVFDNGSNKIFVLADLWPLSVPALLALGKAMSIAVQRFFRMAFPPKVEWVPELRAMAITIPALKVVRA